MAWGIQKFLIKRQEQIATKTQEKYWKYLLAKQKPVYLTNIQQLSVAKNIKIQNGKPQQNDFYYWIDSNRELDKEEEIDGIAIMFVERLYSSSFTGDNGEPFVYTNLTGNIVRYVPK